MKAIEKEDILLIVGLSLIGTGLFYWFGIGPALAIPGLIITGLTIFGK